MRRSRLLLLALLGAGLLLGAPALAEEDDTPPTNPKQCRNSCREAHIDCRLRYAAFANCEVILSSCMNACDEAERRGSDGKRRRRR